MIFVNFDHVTYFDAENSEFLQYRLSVTVNVKVVIGLRDPINFVFWLERSKS